jgi:hypothetical protein
MSGRADPANSEESPKHPDSNRSETNSDSDTTNPFVGGIRLVAAHGGDALKDCDLRKSILGCIVFDRSMPGEAAIERVVDSDREGAKALDGLKVRENPGVAGGVELGVGGGGAQSGLGVGSKCRVECSVKPEFGAPEGKGPSYVQSVML